MRRPFVWLFVRGVLLIAGAVVVAIGFCRQLSAAPRQAGSATDDYMAIGLFAIVGAVFLLVGVRDLWWTVHWLRYRRGTEVAARFDVDPGKLEPQTLCSLEGEGPCVINVSLELLRAVELKSFRLGKAATLACEVALVDETGEVTSRRGLRGGSPGGGEDEEKEAGFHITDTGRWSRVVRIRFTDRKGQATAHLECVARCPREGSVMMRQHPSVNGATEAR